jgi:hypothetical protein
MIRIALLSLLAACGSTSDAAPAHPAATSASPHEVCVQMFQRQRSCTDQFIPALVDARARLDMPAGIAAQVKADRAGVIAQANTEWASDSTDAAIEQTCTRITDDPDVPTAQSCLAKAGCDPFVSCIVPVLEKHLHK